jgi:hypothetical protein
MRTTILVLTLVACSVQPALACRGPFSAPYNIHLKSESQVYLGKVLSVEAAVINPGTPYERKVIKTRLKVIRAWQPNPPDEVAIADVYSSVGDPKSCVEAVHPKVGEEWLVVAMRNGDSLQQDNLMGFSLGDDSQSKREVLDAINRFRANSFSP